MNNPEENYFYFGIQGLGDPAAIKIVLQIV
jgi:hypothetical protein